MTGSPSLTRGNPPPPISDNPPPSQSAYFLSWRKRGVRFWVGRVWDGVRVWARAAGLVGVAVSPSAAAIPLSILGLACGASFGARFELRLRVQREF